MQLIDSFVRNPVKVTVGVLLVVLFGSIALSKMPKQLTPEVENPVLRIETRWPGASPKEIEREIVLEQEEQLKSVQGLIKMSSECMDSEGRISLEFVVGTDINEAMLKVSNRLHQVREYPIDALEPVIETRNVSDRSIARFVLSPKPPTQEIIIAFQKEHPELAEALEPVLRAMNPALMVFRLRRLYEEQGEEHPQLSKLLPPEIDLMKLRRFTEDVIEARLERVNGVSNANVYGGLEEELQVIVDPHRLAARNLTIIDVRAALRGQNKDTSGGDFWEGKRRYVIRTLGQFRDPEQVKSQVLSIHDGAPVYVRDVAEVRQGFKKPTSISRRYGTSSNGLSVQRQSGANVLEVMEGLKAAVIELNEGILKQKNLELYQYYDETDYIHSAMGLVVQNIFIGSALTMIVLMLFLHLSLRTLLVAPVIAATAVAAVYVSSWFFVMTLLLIIVSGLWFGRGALVVGLAIPTSVVGTFLMLGIMGRSLNVISLAGLAFAVGMLVDSAVVVLENIHRRCQQGEPSFTAAVRGTQEVWGAVVASTLTTVAVFLPVVFVEEISGQLFRDIALAISFAVTLSLIISFTLIPTASARLYRLRRSGTLNQQGSDLQNLGNGNSHDYPVAISQTLKPHAGSGHPVSNLLLGVLNTFGSKFVRTVVGMNCWIQQGTVRSLAVVILLTTASLGLSYLLFPKVDYLPAGNRNFVFMQISPPPGYNMNQLMEMGEKIESELKSNWDVDPNSPESKQLETPVINYYFFVVRGRRVFMGCRADDPTRVRELLPLLESIGSQFPGTKAVAKQSSLFERGISGGRTIDIEITGPDLKTLIEHGRTILTKITETNSQGETFMPGLRALPRPSLDLSSPEIHLQPKIMESAEMGVTAEDLGYTVDALVDGAYAGDFYVGGDKIDLTIVGTESFAERTQDLETLPVATPSGQVVPLSALATVSLSSGPEQINRRERMRAITIQVSPPLAVPLEEAMQRIEQEIVLPMQSGGELQDGYMINLSGTADKLRDTWESLKWNLLLALAITYLLMAALFESWLYPFVIIMSVPLGAVGGILGLRLLNVFILQSLDVLTMLGFVILIGTVVNNAILIVHQSLNHIRLEGMTPREAIPESVRSRIRPIFITTMTTVLGLLPLVLFPGAGSELYRGLGSVVLGGLLVSTIFTLILVPTVFTLMMDAKGFLLSLSGRFGAMESDPELVPHEEPRESVHSHPHITEPRKEKIMKRTSDTVIPET
jgi:HAE1 family hydrophobic/amphiphilic exporter-1